MLKLNADSVTLYNSIRSMIVESYSQEFTSKLAIVNAYQDNRFIIADADSSNDEPDDCEIDAGHAATLHQLNTRLHYEAMDKLNKLSLASSHAPATIESSNTANTTEVITVSNSTIDISTLDLNQLAALQLQIAQRMQEIISSQRIEPTTTIEADKELVVSTDEPTEYGVEVIEAAPTLKASRVKKSDVLKSIDPDITIVEVTTQPKVAEKASDMKYADLRSFISKATKSSGTAKEHAQSIARKYGAKSWATVGRAGYEEIYNLIK